MGCSYFGYILHSGGILDLLPQQQPLRGAGGGTAKRVMMTTTKMFLMSDGALLPMVQPFLKTGSSKTNS
jgi:hypothetical protein